MTVFNKNMQTAALRKVQSPQHFGFGTLLDQQLKKSRDHQSGMGKDLGEIAQAINNLPAAHRKSLQRMVHWE